MSKNLKLAAMVKIAAKISLPTRIAAALLISTTPQKTPMQGSAFSLVDPAIPESTMDRVRNC
jgi:hypothetical protein